MEPFAAVASTSKPRSIDSFEYDFHVKNLGIENVVLRSNTVSTRSIASSQSSTWCHNVDELDMMAEFIFSTALALEWCSEIASTSNAISVLVRSRQMTVTKPNVADLSKTWQDVAAHMHIEAFLVMMNDSTAEMVARIPPMRQTVQLRDGRHISVLEDISAMSTFQRSSDAGYCIIRDIAAAVIWTTNARNLVSQGRICEQELSLLQWITQDDSSRTWTLSGQDSVSEKEVLLHESCAKVSTSLPIDLEGQLHQRTNRLIWPSAVACSFILMGLIAGKLLSSLLKTILQDRTYHQVLFALYLPLGLWLSSFFLSIIIVGVYQLLGPICQMQKNSTTYSGVRPDIKLRKQDLPHITVQCPVYKEDLLDVIDPTMKSIQAAISHYQSQGGTASVMINDDGLRLFDVEEQGVRIKYYEAHNFGWIARPPHGERNFVRVGSFKKASNLNFGIRTSMAIEARHMELSKQLGESEETYTRAREEIVHESNGTIWAGGDVGLGSIFLLIDADTRVPKNCFSDAVKEFYETADLALLQHVSGVLQVSHNFWENSLAHFTRNNYFGTRYVVSGGDSTPYFGHNAFLRLSALEEIAHIGADRQKCWWSEGHVSEDFEMSLKLLATGYSSRMVGYTDGEFREGVSLTVSDELYRWEKYAFGISQLIFHPVWQWPRKGPFTPLFKLFLTSDMDLSAKVSSLFYMGTYYGIALAWLMCLVNYIFLGWFPYLVRPYYVDSLQVLIAVSVIFSLKDAIVGPCVRYRLQEVPLGRGLLDSLKYFFIMSLFLQGISMHVSKCLVWHLCGIDMSWGSTNKSLDTNATIKDDLPNIWKRFKAVYLTVALLSALMLLLGFVVPQTWRITSPKAILPLAWTLFWHAAVPLVLHNRSFLAEFYKLDTRKT